MLNQLDQQIQAMSRDDLYEALYLDPLTKVHNRLAFEKLEVGPIAIIDLDSLKYVNDSLGHRAGDDLLVGLGNALREVFGQDNVFRLGDEFVVRGHLQYELKKGLIKVDNKFPRFSYGIGMVLAEADDSLRLHKLTRKNCGKRALRGEPPVWLLK